jgi:two-component system OmpR family response regulator
MCYKQAEVSMRILVVEDEASLARQLTASIAEAGYAVDHAADGECADFLAQTEQYDAMVLDLGLPKIDGLTLLRNWRDSGIATPVIVLTARGSWHEKVRGIDGGADDYVSKPFRIEEVLARLRALMRRANGHLTPELRAGSVTLDPRQARVTLDGAPVKLTSHEFRVLSYLMHHRGLSPINQLHNRLTAVHKGVAPRVGGNYPAEVQPLVDDLNALLDERERRVARAVAKAGDLAHGLKTPLAVLAHEAQQVRAAGHEQLAAEIDQQIDRMRRQIDYHLAHARSVASFTSPASRVSVAASAEGLARALERLHAERDLGIEIDAPASHVFRGQREDLDEMLGNLLDNACKWARARVRLTSSKEGERIVIAVEDDGPGIEPSMREAVMRRGVRADEAGQGSGLGLAIVRDLAEIHGVSFSIE